ncbi:MAG: phosphodiester glycosidase family protein [Cyanobacteria bacterium J06632_22]
MLQLGCQFEWVEQSAVAQAEGQYRRVQFTYLGEGEETPKRFTADVLTFAPGAVRAELLDQPDLQQYETVPEAAQKRGAIAAVNGGYYGEEFEPIGLYILNGQSLQPMSNASGLLSGVVNIDATGQVNLETRANFSSSRAVSALQSGPFLVDPGNVLGIYSDNNKLRKRSVVALSEQRELIILTTSPVSLYTLAQCLHTQAAGVGVVSIERALNLDGGISTGMFALLSNQALAKTEEVAVRTILMFYAE